MASTAACRAMFVAALFTFAGSRPAVAQEKDSAPAPRVTPGIGAFVGTGLIAYTQCYQRDAAGRCTNESRGSFTQRELGVSLGVRVGSVGISAEGAMLPLSDYLGAMGAINGQYFFTDRPSLGTPFLTGGYSSNPEQGRGFDVGGGIALRGRRADVGIEGRFHQWREARYYEVRLSFLTGSRRD